MEPPLRAPLSNGYRLEREGERARTKCDARIYRQVVSLTRIKQKQSYNKIRFEMPTNEHLRVHSRCGACGFLFGEGDQFYACKHRFLNRTK